MNDLFDLNKKLKDTHAQLLQTEKLVAVGQLAVSLAGEVSAPADLVLSNIDALETQLEELVALIDSHSASDSSAEEVATEPHPRRELDSACLHREMVALLMESRQAVNRIRKLARDIADFSRGAGQAQPAGLADASSTAANDAPSDAPGDAPSASETPATITKVLLLVEDESLILQSLLHLFGAEGYELLTATSSAEAFRLLAEHDVQVILSDQSLPDMTGVAFLTKARELYPDSVRIILSAHADNELIAAAVNDGHVHNFVLKPWSNDALLTVVRESFAHSVLPVNAARFYTIYSNRNATAHRLRYLLLVDDNEQVTAALIRLFRDEGYYLLTAKNGEEALQRLATHSVQVILADQNMPGMNGIGLLSKTRAAYPKTVRILMSDFADAEALTDAINQDHIYKFVFKPWDDEKLLVTIREAFALSSLADQGDQFFQLYETSAEGIIITDKHNIIQAVNRAFTRVTGYPASEVIGKTPALLKSNRHDANFYRELWSRLLKDGKWIGEIQNRRKNGEIYSEWLTLTVIRDPAGHISHYIGQFSDISRQRRK